jgi:oligopeptide/dipeptide ABC transporter ATP-binding protein
MNEPLLETRGLTKIFVSQRGWIGRRRREVRALDHVDLTLSTQETLGVVGESGCGKTTLGRVIMGLTPPSSGEMVFEGRDLVAPDQETVELRRREMQMVFQNPYSSFDPRFTILRCVAEPLRTHTELRGEALEARVRELLEQVGMPGDILHRYAHEFSGGQLQRVAVARALALNPKFIVLDEPTSALDVSVQAQILNLLAELQAELQLTYLFISHDLGVVKHISEKVAVMYLGRVVEQSSTADLFAGKGHAGGARHPYTKALLSANPSVDAADRQPVGDRADAASDPAGRARRERMVLKGSVPDAANPPSGCYFHPRCPIAVAQCREEAPPLTAVEEGHQVACWLA